MRLSRNVRQVTGAAMAAIVSTSLVTPAVERHDRKFGRPDPFPAAQVNP